MSSSVRDFCGRFPGDESMSFNRSLFLCLLLSMASAALAQPSAAPAAKPQAEAAVPVSTIVENQLKTAEREFVEAAEAMPEDKYNFTPDNLKIQGSEYKGVKTFSEEVKHVAVTNFEFFSAVLGEKPPVDVSQDNGSPTMTSKAEIIKLLKDSFALGHRACQSLTAENMGQQVPIGQGKTTRLFLAMFASAHAFDHYGQMVEYLRMNGIIPPASRPRK
jgi:uncharacterized damage-inducible protein DinB